MAELTQGSLWTRMRYLVERLITAIDRDEFLDTCLDALVHVLEADRAVIMLGPPGAGGQVVAARGRERRTIDASAYHDIRHATLEDSFRRRRCVVWPGAVSETRESIVDSFLVGAIAAPLREAGFEAGQRPRETGVVYLDYQFRHPPINFETLGREFFESASVLISLVIEQRQQLVKMTERLRLERVQAKVGTPPPTLEEMLRPRSLAALRKDIEACIKGESSVVILGESGTGKTQLAMAIAEASGRTPIVRATLGSSDDLNTITSELFGHERGAFSGAVTRRQGLVEFANNGTLILDEILNLPIHAQQLLLDFTQFGTYRPLGYQGAEPKRAHVRILGATNGNMRRAMTDGRFRPDLYFRLAGIVLHVPPLRDRREDIPGLAESFLRRKDPTRNWRLSSHASRLLTSSELTWPGNVRELEGVTLRARDTALAENAEATTLRAEHFQLRRGGQPIPIPERSDGPSYDEIVSSAPPAERSAERASDPRVLDTNQLSTGWLDLSARRTALDQYERDLIDLALKKYRGVVAHAAKDLKVSRTSLLSRMETLGIDRYDYKR